MNTEQVIVCELCSKEIRASNIVPESKICFECWNSNDME